MGNLFAELNSTAEKQRQEAQQLTQSPPPKQILEAVKEYPIKVAQKSERINEPSIKRRRERASEPRREELSKLSIKHINNALSEGVSTQAVEDLSYDLRRVLKVKLNTEIPETWKKKLDSVALDLGVGKYELFAYIIGKFLGEVEESNL